VLPPAGGFVRLARGCYDRRVVANLIDLLARLTPEQRLRRNDRVVAEFLLEIDRLRRNRGPQ
jgi:hypothetical protein